MSRLSILFSAPYMIPFVDRFQPIFDQLDIDLIVVEVQERLNEAQILPYAGQFDGTICGDDSYTARVLEACSPRLKVISKWGTGIDSIDRSAATRLGIQVCNTPNAFTLAVADTVMGYMLAFARRQPWMDRAMKAGEWKKMPGRSLSETTLGVIGVGNIGKAVIHRARAFGMHLLGNDIIDIDPQFIIENDLEMTTLDSLLQRSDFISLNCDLNQSSYHLIDKRALSVVKPGAILINTARGPIIDEPALIKALQDGPLGGAALDVYETEPLPPDSPLLEMDHVMLSPHNANSSPTAWENVHWNTIRNLLDGLGLSTTNIKR